MGEVVKLVTFRDALSYGDRWQGIANRLEVVLMLVTAQRDASQLLLKMAQDECDRLRELIK